MNGKQLHRDHGERWCRTYASLGVVIALSAHSAGCGNDGEGRGAAPDGAAASNAGPDGSQAGGAPGSGGANGGGAVDGSVGSGGAGGLSAGGAGGTPVRLDAAADAAPPIVSLRKVDLLLVVDNSISMADKVAFLRQALPDLVAEFADPLSGVEDLHVGAITSSLGGFGGDVCSDLEEQKNDRAHLIGTLPRASALSLPGGFVTWDPSVDLTTFTTEVEEMVTLAGEVGCGWEATLEAMYRFLADPNPPASIVLQPCSATNPSPCARTTGTDDILLAQRQAFLRPDSLVAVVVLTDENDCSMRPEGQLYYTALNDPMFRGSAACQTNPNDPCCYSCGASPPAGCTADPICSSPLLASADDSLNLRCFEQKRRFGIDTLYPVSRYRNALTKQTLCTSRADLDAEASCPDADMDGSPDVVDNPLFRSPTSPSVTREASMVQLLGIVGVPWQNIAADTDLMGQPLPAGALQFQTASELEQDGTWLALVGDSAASPPIPPGEPLMVESVAPRSGTTLATGEPIAPPSAGYLENSVNGHEWNPVDDLQFACIFELPEARDCASVITGGCDCTQNQLSALANIPLCQAPDGSYSTLQSFAKAYPGLRHLELLRGLGEDAVVASICVRNATDATAADFGYRPAINSALERWKARLAP